MTLAIRRFRRADSLAVGRLIRRIVRSNDLSHYPSQVVAAECRRFSKRALESSTVARWVATDDGKIIATVGADGDRVVALYVSKSRRGRGVGSKLLRVAERHVLRRFNRIRIIAAVPAAGFYAAKGYARVARRLMVFDGVAYDVVKMVKRELGKTTV